MQKPTVQKTPLARGIALALGLSTLAPGFAQAADEQPAALEEVVITGIRASLEMSMTRKVSIPSSTWKTPFLWKGTF